MSIRGTVYFCRFNLPGARVRETNKFQAELDRVKEEDEYAYNVIRALICDAEQYGLPIEDNAQANGNQAESSYRCPVGASALKRLRGRMNPPWTGELRIETENGAENLRLLRVYFHDLVQEHAGVRAIVDDVLVSSVRDKNRKRVKNILRTQDHDIVSAMETAQRWVKGWPGLGLRGYDEEYRLDF